MTAIKIPICSQTDAFRCIARIVNPINPSKYNEIRYGPVLRDALIGWWRWLVLCVEPLRNLRAIKEIVRRKSSIWA